MEPEVTLGPEGCMSLNRGSEFSRTCLQALHSNRLPLRWQDNKYEKAIHKVSQAYKFINRLGRVESSLKLSGQLLVATASALGPGAVLLLKGTVTFTVCLLSSTPSFSQNRILSVHLLATNSWSVFY